jgi:hypothetical protein
LKTRFAVLGHRYYCVQGSGDAQSPFICAGILNSLSPDWLQK